MRDLLRLRRESPVFHKPRQDSVDGAVLGPEAFVLRFFGKAGDDRLLLLNLGLEINLHSSPEPLLAPAEGTSWKLIWSSEDPRYGGGGTPAPKNGGWTIPGPAALVLAIA